MSLSNLLVPNNFPARSGTSTVGALDANTSGVKNTGAETFSLGQQQVISLVSDVPAGDYLINFKTDVSSASTSLNRAVEAIIRIIAVPDETGVAQTITENTYLRKSDFELASTPGVYVIEDCVSGTVLVRLTQQADIALTGQLGVNNNSVEVGAVKGRGLVVMKVAALSNPVIV